MANCKLFWLLLFFQKKEWLCLNCQTQRAMSGSLGDIPPPAAQPTGSPRANHQPAQQKGPTQVSGPRTSSPHQQQKTPGPQVSGPNSSVKQAGLVPQTKDLVKKSPPTKTSPQSVPQHKGTHQTPSQTKGPTQPPAQSNGSQMKGPTQSHAQNKGPSQASNQVKVPNQAKGPPHAKGSAQPSAQGKGSSHSSGTKASSAPGKGQSNHAKASTTPSKTASIQSKPTGNNQVRKQPQNQEKTKVSSKALKEDPKSSQKKAMSETTTSPKDTKIVDDAKTSRHHEVSYLQLSRLHLFLLIHLFD